MIGVIADDLTGAAELGAAGVRRGLRAEIIFDGVPGGGAELACVDTDSRSCAPAEAGARVRAAAKLLTAAGARWIYKKVDSVLRGPVTAEIEALMEQLGLESAVLVPANPSLGRVIREGKYYVRDRLIHETEFARDPEHPRQFSDVRKMIGRPAMPLHVCGPREPLPASGMVIGEVSSAEDVRAWVGRINPKVLAAGGVEFFGALLDEREPRSSSHLEAPGVDPDVAELFVCGTTSESSREFVRAEQASGTPVISLPKEAAGGVLPEGQIRAATEQAVAALRARKRVILNIALPPVMEHIIAKQLALHLVRIASLVIEQSEANQVYVEGGATAVALVRQMGWGRLAVLGELAAGVAVLGVGNGRTVRLIVKPGSYVWPAALARRVPQPAG